jgi:hypothetical protein
MSYKASKYLEKKSQNFGIKLVSQLRIFSLCPLLLNSIVAFEVRGRELSAVADSIADSLNKGHIYPCSSNEHPVGEMRLRFALAAYLRDNC